MNKSDPIGIFDSGIGGLTVVNAIRHLCPQESIVYFGDTIHLPYGDKSADSIRYYALRIAKFLIDKNCKAIVIACNSASAAAYSVLKEFYTQPAIVVNAVDPLVREVTGRGHKTYGVIGTRATIASKSYSRRIKEIQPTAKVYSLETPLLAPMIESGFHKNEVSQDIIKTYLDDLPLESIDCLLLACTHYPLIRDQILSIVAPYGVEVYDSAGPVSHLLRKQLKDHDLATEAKTASHEYFLSESTDSFRQTAAIFLGNEIHIEESNLWV